MVKFANIQHDRIDVLKLSMQFQFSWIYHHNHYILYILLNFRNLTSLLIRLPYTDNIYTPLFSSKSPCLCYFSIYHTNKFGIENLSTCNQDSKTATIQIYRYTLHVHRDFLHPTIPRNQILADPHLWDSFILTNFYIIFSETAGRVSAS